MILRCSDSFRKIFKKTFFGRVILVYNRYTEKLVCNLIKRGTLQPAGWFWTAASEVSKMSVCNVIQFLPIKISFGILLYHNTYG